MEHYEDKVPLRIGKWSISASSPSRRGEDKVPLRIGKEIKIALRKEREREDKVPLRIGKKLKWVALGMGTLKIKFL